MTSPQPDLANLADSPAFREAALRSEMRKAYAVLLILAMVVVFVFLRISSRKEVSPVILIAAAVGMGVLITVQVAEMLLIRWALRRGEVIPQWIVVATIFGECLVPSGLMLSYILYNAMPPYAALGTPALLAYPLMVTLNTLRLRPVLCVLAGAVCAGGYAAILTYVRVGLGLTVPTTGLPPPAYYSFAALIFINGVAAALVAREIRSHVAAALGEAETRRQVERLEQDMSVARGIQQALIPQAAPQIAGYDIAGWNRPADQTGGDYYDWQQLPDGNWIITLADVSGHGIGPALVTAACRAYVRAASTHEGDLASLTSRVNRLLADDLPSGRFVTMASVLIPPDGEPVSILSAGHGPIVLYLGKSGEVRDVLSHGLPLAIAPDMTYGPAQSIRMEKGDILALVTDGYTEWSKPGEAARGEEYGVIRLKEAFRRYAELPAAQMIAAVTDEVVEFTLPAKQQDDLTMVVVKRVG